MTSYTVAMEILCITHIGSILFRNDSRCRKKRLHESQMIIFLVKNGQNIFKTLTFDMNMFRTQILETSIKLEVT